MSWSLVSWVLINRGLIHWGLLLNWGVGISTLVVDIHTVSGLVPTILIVGFAVVLHGRKTGWSDLVCHRWRTVTGISLVEICCGCLRDVFLDVISVIVAIGSRMTNYDMSGTPLSVTQLCSTALRERSWIWRCSSCREVELNISFNSATIGRYTRWKCSVLTLATMALLPGEVTNLDLLSDDC
ncbi:hypothetical protein Tco_0951598 [Tanacetum coccineum]|uniref:Uncharacterized protein n=1 Tax=Tanacetum coccineum TaxID=301880 RepID=A0ABQ5DXD8_9ASTR